jgi:hypothetical protein
MKHNQQQQNSARPLPLDWRDELVLHRRGSSLFLGSAEIVELFIEVKWRVCRHENPTP